jgi:hypothetical protein
MTKSIHVIAAVALTIAAVVAWANASIRKDAALQLSGPALTDAQIDVRELTKNVGSLPIQEFAAY